jgi:hypothetical protein
VNPVDRNDTDRMRLRSIRSRLTYANVASSIALFLALGGTSYALTLPHDSVGAKQLRTGSVGRAEIRTGGVRSAEIRDRAIAVRDISSKAMTFLRGQQGPAGPSGPSYYLEADSGGGHTVGNGSVVGNQGANGFIVHFARSVATCALVGSPAAIPGGLTPEASPGSTVIVSHTGDDALVRTYNASDQPQGLPFTLIAAC